jgi:hypothetical protein
VATASSDEVISKLSRYSEEEVTGIEKGFAGGVGGTPRAPRGVAAAKPEVEAPKALDRNRTLYQSRVRSLVNSGVDVTAQAVLSADRRSVRVSMQPVFNTMDASKPVKVTSPVVPGAGLKP